MGAFFLFDKTVETINQKAVLSVFIKKGFCEPIVFDLNKMELWLYKKQLVHDENFILQEDGSGIFSTGTVVYKGLSYRQSLDAILNDKKKGCLEVERLIGNFCLIFYINNEIQILLDRMYVQHVFIDKSYYRLSSSFLAVLTSFSNPKSLNKLALYEKIATGYIVGPDTLIEDIYQITPQNQKEVQNSNIRFIQYPETEKEIQFCQKGLEDCVNEQINFLKDYFIDIKPLAQEYGADLGLSSGYDSRLLYLLANSCDISLSAHTHLTKGVHEPEYQIVKKITAFNQTPLRTIRTRKMEDQSEEDLVRILDDGLYYFDGRNSHNIGAFGDTYTRSYRIKTLGKNRLGLNGLGGEIYRNSYYTSRHRLNFRNWMQNHIYYPNALLAIKNVDNRINLDKYIIDKISLRLEKNLNNVVDFQTIKRYYSEIRMPDCNGNNNNAHNQLAFFLTPFIEYPVVKEGYKSSSYIGSSGNFQAAMLTQLDNDIAKIDSCYGFPLSEEPLSHVMYALVRAWIPNQMWVWRKNWRYRYQDLGLSLFNNYLDLCERSIRLKEIDDLLRTQFPEVYWDIFMRDNAAKRNAIFVGSFIHKFHSNISIY